MIPVDADAAADTTAVAQRPPWRWALLFAALLAIAAVPLLHDVTGPYVGYFEGNSAWVSSAARNHVVHGYRGTRLAVANNGAVGPREHLRYYVSHPPLVPLLVSVSFHALGMHEWAARLVAIAFSLGSVVLVQRLGWALGGERLGWLAAFLFAVMPMNGYFGRVVNHEPITMFFTLAAALAYLHWHRGRDTRWFTMTAVAFVLAALGDWPGYYLALVLPAHHVLAARERTDLRILLLPGLAVLLFALHLTHVVVVEGAPGLQKLADTFVYRTQLAGAPADGTGHFGTREFVLRQVRRALVLFTPPTIALATLALLRIRSRPRDVAGAGWEPLFVVALLMFGMLHVVLFRHGAWVHDYWLHYLAGPLALLAAHGALSLGTAETRTHLALVVGAMAALTAEPEIRALQARQRPLGEAVALVSQTSDAGDLVLGNDRLIGGAGHRLEWHARRDLHYGVVRTLDELMALVAGERPRSFVYYLAEGAPIDAALERWLEAHATVTEATVAGTRHRIYRGPRPEGGRR